MSEKTDKKSKLPTKKYETELKRLQEELFKLQNWVIHTGQKVVIIFEGRDAAGKGGMIKRIVQTMNDRHCRVVALGAPSTREEKQWYFQRYVSHLPTAGEIVIFDRSWYTLVGVERVMGFYPEETCQEFFRSCPEFERMLIRAGIKIIKYWLSITPEEQEKRFQARLKEPIKRWKLSKMDLESRSRWEEYSQAYDEMFEHTNIPEAPWWIVNGNNKKRARLNCITNLLTQLPYTEVDTGHIDFPERKLHITPGTPSLPPENYIEELF